MMTDDVVLSLEITIARLASHSCTIDVFIKKTEATMLF